MGFETDRFREDVDEELVCPICSGVLEDPIQATLCEHAFCRSCIHEWISHQPTCPVDRQAITSAQLRPSRLLRNLLSRLSISCDYAQYGCEAVLKLDLLPAHVEECEHDPKRPMPCEQGCGLVIPKDELKYHNCVKELRALIHSQQQKMADFEKDCNCVKELRALIDSQEQKMADFEKEIAKQKSEIILLKKEVTEHQEVPRKRKAPSKNETIHIKKVSCTIVLSSKCDFLTKFSYNRQAIGKTYNFSLLTHMNKIQLFPLVCWKNLPEPVVNIITTCTATITKVSICGINEPPIVVNFSEDVPRTGEFQIPLAVGGMNVTLESNSEYTVKLELDGWHYPCVKRSVKGDKSDSCSFSDNFLTLNLHNYTTDSDSDSSESSESQVSESSDTCGDYHVYYCFPSSKLRFGVLY